MCKHTCTHVPNTVQTCFLEEILFSGLVLSQFSGKQAEALGAQGSCREKSCPHSLYSPCESDLHSLCSDQSVTANKTAMFNNPFSQVLFLHTFQSVWTVQKHTTQMNKTHKAKGSSQTVQANVAQAPPNITPGRMLRNGAS